MAQAAVFLGKTPHGIEQPVKLLTQGGQLLMDLAGLDVIGRAHARNYNRTPPEVSRSVTRSGERHGDCIKLAGIS
jgi:hypothetical protein